MKRKIFVIGFTLLLALAFAAPALAGGWAVITLDEFPVGWRLTNRLRSDSCSASMVSRQ